jgi:hypothetical protein
MAHSLTARSVNLMTQPAQFRADAERIARVWILGIGALVLALVPFGLWQWRDRSQMVRENEALEASYEPLRRLAAANRALAAQATELVTRERDVLQLARQHSTLSLVSVVSDVIEASQGAAFVDHITITRDPAKGGLNGGGKLTLSAMSTLGYEASRLAKELDRPPFTAVKIESSETTADGGVVRKHHVIDCEF